MIGKGANTSIDVTVVDAPEAGHLLLCSDGLWGEIGEERIRSIIGLEDDPEEACRALIKAANAAGGSDNITALLVRFPGENPEPEILEQKK